MNAMILAAGRGTRLGELGASMPKVLIEVGHEPLLGRQIHYLKDNGIQRIVINAHHLAGQIVDFVASRPDAQDIEVVLEPKLLGTAGGVRNALGYLGDDAFVVLYGDVIIDEPIGGIVTTHRRCDASATLTIYESAAVDGKGTVDVDVDGRITAFREKATSHITDCAYINAGLYIIDPVLLHDLPTDIALDFGHDVFPAALARGTTIAGHVLSKPVIDVGTPTMLAIARRAG